MLGTLPGASEDGSYVYFVANGVLAPGAQRGDCPRSKPLLPSPQAPCNLYVSEPDPEDPGQRADQADRAALRRRRRRLGARALAAPGLARRRHLAGLANGRYLAFMSQQELTGYDNVDANPQAEGAHDEEVFVYDAASGRLVCASCNPDGEPPHGVFDTEQAGEGLGLTRRPPGNVERALAGRLDPGLDADRAEQRPSTEHQSRYLSNSGRLVLQQRRRARCPASAGPQQARGQSTAEPSQVGVENVYEYEPSGNGSCAARAGCVALISSGTSDHESAFLDASENGDDVFFLTAAQLVAQDTDNSLDIYDARVCGTPETQPCLPAPSTAATAMQRRRMPGARAPASRASRAGERDLLRAGQPARKKSRALKTTTSPSRTRAAEARGTL